MPKLFIIVICTATVLVSGLVSCSKDKKITDVYAAAPPKVKNGHLQEGLKQWDLRARKSFDLADSLDFTESAPSDLVINSTCRLDGERRFETFPLGGQKEIRILQILPEEILAQDFKIHEIDCDFVLQLSNDKGSTHFFNISSVPVTDNSRGGVQVKREPEIPDSSGRLKASTAQLDGVRIRYKNTAAASVSVICQDLNSVSLPFEKVLDLVHLSLSSPELRPNRVPDTLIFNQLQNCRAVVTQAGQRVDISPTFQLIFARPALPIALVAAPFPIPGLPGQGNVNVIGGRPMALGIWRISNPDAVNRYVRFPKKAVSVKIGIFMSAINTKQIINMIYIKPWANPFPILDPSFKIRENAEFWTITLEPGRAMDFDLRFQSPRLNCNPAKNYQGLIFSEIEPFNVVEVSAADEILTTQTVAVEKNIYVTDLDESQLAKIPMETTSGRCSWP